MKTVLVVDDEECIRELIRDVLESPDCRLLEAGSGEEGLELATKEHPDVVLADFFMPGVSGVQLLHQLRMSPITWDIPVVLMSGLGADEALLKLLVSQDTAYLMKPFTASELLLKLQETMRAAAMKKRLPQQVKGGMQPAVASNRG